MSEEIERAKEAARQPASQSIEQLEPGGLDTRLPLIGPEAVTAHHITAFNEKTGKREVVKDSAIDALAGALTFAKESAGVIQNTHGALAADVTKTPDARAMLSRESALRVLANSAARIDKARQMAVSAIEDLESARNSEPPPAKDQTELMVQAAILQRLGAMNDDERKAATSKVDDVATVRAILSAPAWLTGVLASELPLIRASYRKRHHPAEFDRAERLKKAVAALDRQAESLMTWVDKLTDKHAVELARNAEANAARALQAAQIQGGIA